MKKSQAEALELKIANGLGYKRGSESVKDGVLVDHYRDNPDNYYVLWKFDPYDNYEYLLAVVDDLILQSKKPVKEINDLAKQMGKNRVFYQDWVLVLKKGTKGYIHPDHVTTYLAEGGKFDAIADYFPNVSKWVSENVIYE